MLAVAGCLAVIGLLWRFVPWQDPFELMEILKKVLVFLDPKHDVDLREAPACAASRWNMVRHAGFRCCNFHALALSDSVVQGPRYLSSW